MKDLILITNPMRVTHNGMKVEFVDNGAEALTYIASVVNKHSNLNPKLIADVYIGDNKLFIAYEYYTLYKEMFLIEVDGLWMNPIK